MINRLELRNITKLREKIIRVIDWSASGLREEVKCLDGGGVSKINLAMLREEEGEGKLGKWMCQPEYLAP